MVIASPSRTAFNVITFQIASLLVAGMFGTQSFGQAYPTSRPVTIAYQFGPGAFDTMLRPLSTEVGKLLGQSVIFENRPGANGRLVLNSMKTAKPDGYNLGYAINGTLIHLPLADANFKLEVNKDYLPVAFVIETAQVLTAHPEVPFRDIKGMIAYAKANPNKLNVAVNLGGASHFIAELIKYTAGIDMAMIPYKSSQAGMLDLVSGRVQLAISSGTAKPFVDSGKLVAVATTAQQRWKAFPNQPTFSEAGLPIVSTVWFAVIAAPGTPRDIVTTLNRAFNTALKQPSIQALYDSEFYSSTQMSPEELGGHIKKEMAVWEPVIRKAGIKME